MEQVLAPALEPLGFKVFRGDNIEATWITPKLIESIRCADLILAVLTEHNPNVFYEMGVAQAWCKPLIAIADVAATLPFDVQDLNTLRHSAFNSDCRLSDEAADQAREELGSRVDPALSGARSEKTAYWDGLRQIGSEFALLAIYSGKRFILEVFETSISDVLNAMNGDYELAEGKPEGLRGLAPRISETSERFYQQSRALEKSVRLADLPPDVKSHCLSACGTMTSMWTTAMRVADRLQKKQSLEAADVDLVRETLAELIQKTNACLDLINMYKPYWQ